MYKLITEKTYEFTIKAPKLENFDVEFSVLTEHINYNIKFVKKTNNLFELIIPEELNKLTETVNYNIFLYNQNHRFSIDSGELQLIRPQEAVDVELTEIDIKLNTDDTIVEIEIAPSKSKLDLRDMVRKDYMNSRVKNILKEIKK